jgi:hypothetical protein
MTNITHTYSGKIRLPLLYNSHHMFIAARKPVKNRGQADVAENEAIK